MMILKAGLYLLSALTCLACAVLLGREYRRSRVRMLLWSTLCFSLLTVNNVMLVVDLAVFPTTVDLRVPRLLTCLAGMLCLLYGFWESDSGRSFR